ncbi:MAG: LysR substrate-binding domain-containing protein [Burkholderiaceae bacterium]|nr:LysR substrate-binding domain-containing protein [Burkholderiaceae bacterium]
MGRAAIEPDRSLDPDDLVLFARVVEAGSFSRAADRHGIPKATVSRRISTLESRIGERLLTRTTRRLSLTEFGERMLAHAQRLAEEADAATALAQHHRTTPQGRLRVSMPPGFAEEMGLVPFLLDFAAAHPRVRLEIDVSARRVDLIAERFDVAVRVAAHLPDDASLVARRVFDLQNALYASPTYLAQAGRPSSPAQLLEHAALGLVSSTGELLPWSLRRGDERWDGLPTGPLASNSVALHTALALRGLGIAALASRVAQPYVEQNRLERVLPDWSFPTMTVWCVTAGRRLLPLRTTAFIEMLSSALATPCDAGPAAADV